MASTAMSIKFDEKRIKDISRVSEVFHMTKTDVINEALNMYLPIMMNDPFFKLTNNVEYASAEETEEILDAVARLTDDDLKISSSKKFRL